MIIYINGKFLSQNITGVQRFAIEILKNLKDLSIDYVLLAPCNLIQKDLIDVLNIRVIGRQVGTIWEQIELPLYLKKKGNPLLLNLCNTAPMLYKNQIITIHDLAFFHNSKWFSKSFFYWYSFLIPRIVKRAKLIFTVSEFSKKEILNRFDIDEGKVKVIYNAVNVMVPKTVLRHKNYILSVGSIDPRKNLELLINAFNHLENDNLKLLIVGGTNSNFANQSISVSSKIEFLGRVPDDHLPYLYSNALAFVYPSLYEGFGIPPLEAMAYSCPVICSNTTSLPEVCGQAALYFSPNSEEELVIAINKIINESGLRNKMIIYGRDRVDFFSWKKSAYNLLKNVNNLLEK